MRNKLNTDQIKLIAIAAMTIDHLAWVFFPGLQAVWYVCALHIIGRLTAPLMWFFIAEGCYYTRNIGRYILRLLVLAVFSHFAFSFAFGINPVPLSTGIFNQTSVIWSLAWAVVLIAVCRREDVPQLLKIISIILICLISFPSDWSSIAVMCPFFLYQHRGDFKLQTRDFIIWAFVYSAVYFIFIDRLYASLQLCTLLVIPILKNYSGKPGKWKGMKTTRSEERV